jgi:hypothetical protein
MKPYFEREGIALYLGDAREVTPDLGLDPARTVVVTDPVWPNPGATVIVGRDDPAALFASVARHFPSVARRAVVELGCDSDARFLAGVPASMPFVRAIWLRLAVPTPKGAVLFSGDVAYVFGDGRAENGRTLIPGEVTARLSKETRRGLGIRHPCPRRMEHVSYLVAHLTSRADTVFDPFTGSGTTLCAAIRHGRRAVGVEIEEQHAEEAAQRVEGERRQVLIPTEAA